MRSVIANASITSAPPPTGQARPARTAASVNLLSPATLERLAATRTAKRFLGGAVALALLVGAGWIVQTERLHAAQQRHATETAQTPPLRARLQSLQPVAGFHAQVAQRVQSASAAMAAEVLFSAALADLHRRTPPGLQIHTMSVTLTPDALPATVPGGQAPTADTAADTADGTADTADTTGTAGTNNPTGAGQTPAPAPGAACARPDPFDPTPLIGCVSLTGTAPSRSVVAALIRALKISSLYAHPFITTTTIGDTAGEQVVQFAGTVGLRRQLISNRYADPAWLGDPAVLGEAQRLVKTGRAAAAQLARQARKAAAAEHQRHQAAAKAAAAAQAQAQADAAAEAKAHLAQRADRAAPTAENSR